MITRMRNLFLATLLTVCVAMAQSFSSGSTGANGPLDLTTGDQTVQLPPSGILNYTTVNIPIGRTLTFQGNLTNTAAVILAQGTVTVSGTINVSAAGLTPGPGGFYGGFGRQAGFGPGAGQPAFAGVLPSMHDGTWIGPLSLVPNIGGSGGGGTSGCGSNVYGGSGGGAITIASSTSVSLSGAILANPSLGGGVGGNECGQSGSSGGGGAVRLVANSINVSGEITGAVVRLEGPIGQVTYTGYGTAPVVANINPLIAPTIPPSITFSSIGGYAVPSSSGSSFTTIDLLLPTQLQDPIPVIVQATNVPVGSPVSITFGGPGGPTSTSGMLSGSTASSSTTLFVSGLVRTGVTYLFALATFDPTLISTNLKQTGPNAVSRIELAALPGGRTTYRFLRRDGSEVNLTEVSPEIRHIVGL